MTAENNSPCPKTSNNADPDLARQQQRSAEIQRLNDNLRKTGRGGRVYFTEGIFNQGPEFAFAVFAAVEAFSSFNCHNDPYGEHDCASLMVDDQKVIWKIDYYDKTQTFQSPDASNPKVTKRVMTVMLAEEY